MTVKNLFRVLYIPFLLFCSNSAIAQNYYINGGQDEIEYELGLSFNAMNCLTDLGGNKGVGKPFLKDLNTGNTKFSVGIFGSAFIQNKFALRVEATYGSLSAKDNVLKGLTDDARYRYNRNLDFQTSIFEAAALAEIHPLNILIDWDERNQSSPRLSPYLLGGVGYFSFRPQGTVPGTNTLVDLKPLRTEGQGFAEFPDREDYKLQQINFPVGLGIKYELSPLLNLRLEALHRILKTDYLDDVSQQYIDPALFDKYLTPQQARIAKVLADKQISSENMNSVGEIRGNPKNNDSYFSINLKISFVLGVGKE